LIWRRKEGREREEDATTGLGRGNIRSGEEKRKEEED